MHSNKPESTSPDKYVLIFVYQLFCHGNQRCGAEPSEGYPASRGFSLAWLLAFAKSFSWLVCHVVGLLYPMRNLRSKPACDFCWACAGSLIRYYRDNDVNLSPERNTILSKTTFTCPSSRQVVLRTTKHGWFLKSLNPISHCFQNILRTKDHLRNFLGGNSTAFNYELFHYNF